MVEVAERASSIVIVSLVEIDISPAPRRVSPFIVLIVVPDVRVSCFLAASVSTYYLLAASVSSLGVFTLSALENTIPSTLGDIVTLLVPSLSSMLLIAFNSAVLRFICCVVDGTILVTIRLFAFISLLAVKFFKVRELSIVNLSYLLSKSALSALLLKA